MPQRYKDMQSMVNGNVFVEIAAILGLATLTRIVGNPLIVLVIMGVMGYRRRTSFLTGLTVAQISEFSLIVAAVSEDSDLSGKSFAELHFRQKFGATLVGIHGGQDQITTINPAERLLGGGIV